MIQVVLGAPVATVNADDERITALESLLALGPIVFGQIVFRQPQIEKLIRIRPVNNASISRRRRETQDGIRHQKKNSTGFP